MHLILQAGNFLNRGAALGNAVGFQLSSLRKLSDTKANKPGITLMHYVAMELKNHSEDMLSWPQKLISVDKACRVSETELTQELASLRKKLASLGRLVSKEGDKKLKKESEEFFKNEKRNFQSITDHEEELKKSKQKLARYLCEKPDRFDLSDCFQTIIEFKMKFKKAVIENQVREEKQQKKKELLASRTNLLPRSSSEVCEPRVSISSRSRVTRRRTTNLPSKEESLEDVLSVTSTQSQPPSIPKESLIENGPQRRRRRLKSQRPLSLVDGLLEKGGEAVHVPSPLIAPTTDPSHPPEDERLHVQMNRFLNPELLIRRTRNRRSFVRRPKTEDTSLNRDRPPDTPAEAPQEVMERSAVSGETENTDDVTTRMSLNAGRRSRARRRKTFMTPLTDLIEVPVERSTVKEKEERLLKVEDGSLTKKDLLSDVNDDSQVKTDRVLDVEDPPLTKEDRLQDVEDAPKTKEDRFQEVEDPPLTKEDRLQEVEDPPKTKEDRLQKVEDAPKTKEDHLLVLEDASSVLPNPENMSDPSNKTRKNPSESNPNLKSDLHPSCEDITTVDNCSKEQEDKKTTPSVQKESKKNIVAQKVTLIRSKTQIAPKHRIYKINSKSRALEDTGDAKKTLEASKNLTLVRHTRVTSPPVTYRGKTPETLEVKKAPPTRRRPRTAPVPKSVKTTSNQNSPLDGNKVNINRTETNKLETRSAKVSSSGEQSNMTSRKVVQMNRAARLRMVQKTK